MWSNGQKFTFWAYGNPIEGATAYHVYHNNKTCCTGEEKDTKRFTLSKNKQNEHDDLENLWIHDFTFWAFEDVRVQKFLGTTLYNINQSPCSCSLVPLNVFSWILASSGCRGMNRCCSHENKCNIQEGDCNSDSDCMDGLICGAYNCHKSRDLWWDSGDDCCQKPSNDSGKILDKHMYTYYDFLHLC